ncbi:Putative membrane protein [Corynebacterium glyciniphilum AJ 3170]|uniref:Putative membrane protein n=1 Tax=Corynebacterium glyciniphilum AJ 3170 TaxID=1404245 RepID=X5E9J3_9CORY|nr:prepilin peptidase [Corynebacterium glyciniphilum]AHW64100.1 Putative membrane protein [Corynebacterium glyciniphilum AJ 3170]
MGVIGGLIVLAWAGTLIVQDIRFRRLPDRLTLPAVPVAWAGVLLLGYGWAVLGGIAWFLLCVLPGLFSPRLRAGGGDAKLALSLGAVATAVGGTVGLAVTVAVASAVTLLFALIPPVRTSALPHGPGMLVATAVVTGVINSGVW